MTSSESEREHQFDVVVVGSGAAGMTAALAAADRGLSVVVVEKADTFGGSTARSGGGVWIPNNAVLRRDGAPDDYHDARVYLEHVAAGHSSPARQQAFLDRGPAMLDFVLRHTPLRFDWIPGYADYYPEAPGGRPLGRTLEPKPFNGRLLGPELRRLNPPYLGAPGAMAVTDRDYKWLSLGTRHPRAVTTALRIGVRSVVGRLLGRHPLTMGQALAAGLRVGLARAGVPVWLETPLRELHMVGDRVTGVWVRRDGARALIGARRGVVLASGGFERNEIMRKRWQREPIGAEWTVGAVANTGEGIEAGQRVGAGVELMDDAWWGPSVPVPGAPYFALSERNLPGSIIVNAAGERFLNECLPYVDAGHVMYEQDAVPAWLIFDQRYRDRYLFATRAPRAPLSRKWYAAEVLFREDSLASLADRIGVPGEALAATVSRFNELARLGTDLDFGRGESAYDQYYGDPTNRPNPCLGELVKPPFYAVTMVPGDLGTKGGLSTDERARVLRADGTVIAGLWAAGNASAAVMGRSYAGAGATIGPAMVFGYIAGLDV